MNGSPVFGVAAVALVLLAAAGRPAWAADVKVTVTNVNGDTGHVRVDLCTRAKFLKGDCPYSAAAPAQPGETVVSFTGVDPGEYAAQAFYDDTDAGRVHRGFLGIPREGVGFSNDVSPLRLTGPQYKDAAFLVPESGAQIRLKLRYLSGSHRKKTPREPAAAQ
jgi:uncharacterized protein (DUF2141 family)